MLVICHQAVCFVHVTGVTLALSFNFCCGSKGLCWSQGFWSSSGERSWEIANTLKTSLNAIISFIKWALVFLCLMKCVWVPCAFTTAVYGRLWICTCEYCWLEHVWATWKTSLLAYVSLSTGWPLTILQQKVTVYSVSVGQLAPHH